MEPDQSPTLTTLGSQNVSGFSTSPLLTPTHTTPMSWTATTPTPSTTQQQQNAVPASEAPDARSLAKRRKQEKNKEAQRRSRQRKAAEMKQLRQRVHELSAEVQQLRFDVSAMKKVIYFLENRVRELSNSVSSPNQMVQPFLQRLPHVSSVYQQGEAASSPQQIGSSLRDTHNPAQNTHQSEQHSRLEEGDVELHSLAFLPDTTETTDSTSDSPNTNQPQTDSFVSLDMLPPSSPSSSTPPLFAYSPPVSPRETQWITALLIVALLVCSCMFFAPDLLPTRQTKTPEPKAVIWSHTAQTPKLNKKCIRKNSIPIGDSAFQVPGAVPIAVSMQEAEKEFAEEFGQPDAGTNNELLGAINTTASVGGSAGIEKGGAIQAKRVENEEAHEALDAAIVESIDMESLGSLLSSQLQNLKLTSQNDSSPVLPEAARVAASSFKDVSSFESVGVDSMNAMQYKWSQEQNQALAGL